jgi:Carboxypeptidase regulatory-like domain
MTATLRVACLLALLLPTASAQQTTPHAVPQKFRISGTAVNAATEQPLAEAVIEIGLPQKQDAVQSVETDENGRFAFEGLSPAKYWLVGERRGFPRQGFNEHFGFFTAIVVGPGLQSENLVFRLRPDASISGTVSDDQNEVVREGQVILFADSSVDGEHRIIQSAKIGTDSAGHYRFSHLRQGRYFVAVSAQPWYAQTQRPLVPLIPSGDGGAAPGDTPPPESANPFPLDVAYPLTYYAGAVEADDATPINLAAGDQAKADIALSAVPAVHLRLLSATMSPSTCCGLTASLSQRTFGAASIFVPLSSTYTAGVMEISGMPPGDYMLNLTSFENEQRSWTQSVRLTADTEMNGTQGRGSPTITGIVTLDGTPLPGKGYVVLRDQASGNALGTQVILRGEFEFQPRAVKPGTYQVGVFNIPNATVVALSASGARVTGQSVSVEDGATVKLVVSMSKGLGEVDGVAERDGNPLPGAMIVLVPDKIDGNESLFRRDQSDSDGTFSLRDVVPGNYTVVAIEQGWDLEWSRAEVLKPYLANGERIEVHAQGKYQVKVKVQ